MDWLSRLKSSDDVEELNCIAHFHLFSQLSLIKFLLQVNKFSSETLSTFYRFIEPNTRTKMLHSDAGVWSILLNFLTSMDVFGINQIRDKKGQNPGGKENKRRKKKQNMSLNIGFKPLSQRTHVNLQRTAPVYLRQDGEEVESNISSLIMVSDMRLSRRGPAALPPIPCIIITEWRCRDAEMQRCRDAEMQGNIATLMSRVHWSTAHPPCCNHN